MQFSTKFTTGDTVVTFDKLWFLQKSHAANYIKSAAEGNVSKLSLLTEPILAELQSHDLTKLAKQVLGNRLLEDYVKALLALGARGYTNAPDFVEKHKYFFHETPTSFQLHRSRPSFKLHNVPRQILLKQNITEVATALKTLEFVGEDLWTVGIVKSMVQQVIDSQTRELLNSETIDSKHLDMAKTEKAVSKAWSNLIHDYIRWATTNSMPGPASADTLLILGREESLRRLRLAEEVLQTTMSGV